MVAKCISYPMLKTAEAENAWATLCYWIWLKAKFQKPIYYNYTARSIGKLLNISKSASSNHIKLMLKYDWVHIKDKHLVLNNFHDINTKLVFKVDIFPIKSEQIASLKFRIIKNNIVTQSKKIKSKKDTVKKARSPYAKLSKTQVRDIRKKGGVEMYEKSLNDRTTLSNKKIAEMLHCCKRTASKVQVRLNKMKLIKSTAFYEPINLGFNVLPTNCFLYKDKFYVKRMANTISLIQHSNPRCTV